MKRKLRSWYVWILLSPAYLSCSRLLAEMRRAITFRPHVVQAFLQLDDPYSYLLSHYLQDLAAAYRIELRVYLSRALSGEFTPQPAMLDDYAVRDCRLLAGELDISFLDKGDAPVVEHREALLDFLAKRQGQDDFAATFHQALDGYWRGDREQSAGLIGDSQPDQSFTDASIETSQSLLRKLGHYGSATLYYGGEWYWGIDRLAHLCDRLDSLGARRGASDDARTAAPPAQVTEMRLPAVAPPGAKHLPPLELYYSFRSPYSYLALRRVFAVADAFCLDLVIRPVLPMVMRGLPVPRTKLLYIVRDAGREARRLGIPFGNICDPLGAGAERCIAVFFHAQRLGREREFMLAAGHAIWAEAVDLATDGGLRTVAERAGLQWPDVRDALNDESWRGAVQDNRDALTRAGLWGVPSYVIGGTALWGQDRVWVLARQIERLCRIPAA
ncbi:MAG: DsbA family protein [Gammaproteobacteria bacterium]